MFILDECKYGMCDVEEAYRFYYKWLLGKLDELFKLSLEIIPSFTLLCNAVFGTSPSTDLLYTLYRTADGSLSSE